VEAGGTLEAGQALAAREAGQAPAAQAVGGASPHPLFLSLSLAVGTPRGHGRRSGAGAGEAAAPAGRRARVGGSSSARLLLLLPIWVKNPMGLGLGLTQTRPVCTQTRPNKVKFHFSPCEILNYFGAPEKLQTAPWIFSVITYLTFSIGFSIRAISGASGLGFG